MHRWQSHRRIWRQFFSGSGEAICLGGFLQDRCILKTCVSNCFFIFVFFFVFLNWGWSMFSSKGCRASVYIPPASMTPSHGSIWVGWFCMVSAFLSSASTEILSIFPNHFLLSSSAGFLLSTRSHHGGWPVISNQISKYSLRGWNRMMSMWKPWLCHLLSNYMCPPVVLGNWSNSKIPL